MLPFHIIIIPVVFVAIVLNSGILQSHVTAVKIGEHTLTDVQFNYYYFSEYLDFINENHDELEELGLSMTSKLRNQEYNGDMTWEDYFKERAIERATQVLLLNDLASEEGYEFTESDYEPVENRISEVKAFCESYGLEVENYFESYYGSGMTEERFENELRLEAQSDAYKTHLADSIGVSESEKDSWISDNGLAADEAVTVRMIYLEVATNRFSGETSEKEWNDLDIKTESLLERWKEDGGDETAFARLTDAYSEEQDLAPGGLYEGLLREDIKDSLADWCFESSRKTGDSTYIRTDTGNYIMLYIEGGNDVMKRVAGKAVQKAAADALVDSLAKDYAVSENFFGMLFAM